ncbi:acylphosphatase [Candidatus Woesearchaeota archaeon]|nr:acylphosphatase [Candidatus Woesearchaeota archaeon]MBI2660725.1 acylphosphatase [Candidatus Woesearchaeota archaeon]
MKCIHLIVSGRVQGVFFRANTSKKANELGLKGYVKNMPDGNVEVVAQGSEEKLDEFIDFLRTGPGIAKVTDIRMTHKQTENFNSFDIRHGTWHQ